MNNPGEGPHYPSYNDPGIAIGGKYPARQFYYFCWTDSKYIVRLCIRICSCAGSCRPMVRNMGPHTGISLLPCAAVRLSPLMIAAICASGNFPSFFTCLLYTSDAADEE